MDTLLRRCHGDHFLRGHVRVRSSLAWGWNHGRLSKYLLWIYLTILICLSFCRTACKSRWNSLTRSVTTNGSRTPRLFYSWTRRICSRRRFARVPWRFASPNTQVSGPSELECKSLVINPIFGRTFQVDRSTARRLLTFRLNLKRKTNQPQKKSTATWRVPQIPITFSLYSMLSPMSS